MKKVRLATTIMVIAFLSLTAMSCKDNKKQDSQDAMHSGMNNDKMNTSNDMMDANAQNSEAEKILADYMTLKDALDRKSTRLNSSHVAISYAVFCMKKK